MTRLSALLPVLLLSACVNSLSGSLDGEALGAFADVVYFELRGVDEATSAPFHDLAVWMLPVEDGCSAMPALLDALEDLREELEDDGLDPTTYCERWEAAWAEHFTGEAFWLSAWTLRARPRSFDETVETTYPWLRRGQVNDGPVFDADFARYAAPDFDACAVEFEGNSMYAPSVYEATGGEVTVTSYSEDDRLQGTLAATAAAADEDGIGGRFDATFCPGAGDWSVVFGNGL